jgi:putative ABC transport system permease protein
VTLEFGGVTQVREDVREAWLWRWLTQFLQDARYGRGPSAKPVFTLAAAASLGLAIGANTAIFSVIHGVLLKPLPYAAPHELVMVWQDMRAKGGTADEWATPGNFVDWRAESRTFASMASIRGFAPTLVGMGDSQVLVASR